MRPCARRRDCRDAGMGGAAVRGFLSFFIDFLISRACLVCGRELRSFDWGIAPALPPHWSSWAHEFSAADFGLDVFWGLRVPAAVLCPQCWRTLEPARTSGHLARNDAAARQVPLISPFFTNEPLLAIIRFLKFSGGKTAVPPIGWWMANALQEHLARSSYGAASHPLLVPVPLHPSREKARGYNQAALLAWEVAERLDLDVESRILVRAKNTKSQTKLDPSERAANVKGAFCLFRSDLANCRNIILVDDLVTMGATVGACIETIEKASPASISVLSAGRARG